MASTAMMHAHAMPRIHKVLPWWMQQHVHEKHDDHDYVLKRQVERLQRDATKQEALQLNLQRHDPAVSTQAPEEDVHRCVCCCI